LSVMCQRNKMTKRMFWAVVFAICVLSHTLVYFHFVYTGDTVASVFGYLISLFVLPVAIIGVLVFALVSLSNLQFTTRQKWTLLLFPIFTMVSYLVYFYLVLQYGGPH
ncbi:hypothetical protein, partial [Alteromonas sp. KUL42]|uniref:hypothetical protein n=1 Tax=Alteromonas sp. KUL42 TaxID=2480797 RepID=UPI001A93AB8C